MINLNQILNKDSKYLSLLNDLKNKNNCSCFGLGFNEISFILSNISSQKILVVNSLNEALKYEEQLNSLNLKTYILQNKIENLYFSYFNNEQNITNLTLSCFKLITHEIDVLIVLNKVLIQKFIDPVVFEKNIIKVNKNSKINFKNLIENLVKVNYKKVDEIEAKGEFTYVGDILTVFPINLNFPIRISFFDDEIEYIKSFSLQTYEVLTDETTINICPNTICFYTDEEYKNIIDLLTSSAQNSQDEEQKKNLNNLIDEIINRPFNKINSSFILPFLSSYNCNIFSYLQEGVVIYTEPKIIVDSLNNDYVNILANLTEQICEGKLINIHKDFYMNKAEIFSTTNTCLAFLNLNTTNKIFKTDKVYSFLSSFVKNYNFNLNFLIQDLQLLSRNSTVILCVENNEKAVKLQEFLNNNSIYSNLITSVNLIKDKGIYFLISKTYYGINFVEDHVLILGNFNLYGTRKVEEQNKKVSKVFFTPKLGDYCVHEIFGICKCIRLEKVNFNNILKDYIVLEFFGGDTLFLPSEKADLITKYVGDNENPKLNKLGSTEFLKEKIKVKNKVKELAFDLLKLYAKREESVGFKYVDDDSVQLEFENAFPFALTKDQENAIADIKKDMQSTKIMDRLICGDVGYGKTEVAMRAIFFFGTER